MNRIWTSMVGQTQSPKKVITWNGFHFWRTLFIGIVAFSIGNASVIGQEPIFHSGTVETVEQWRASSVHVISDNLTISASGSVTIDPGTIIKVQYGRNITVHGIWNSVGTIDNPVIITSYKDDSFGGDTNGDGSSVGLANDWSNLRFEPDALVGSDQSILTHTKILYGNQVYSRAELAITNCEIAYMQDNGVQFYDTTGTVSLSQIHHTGNYAVYFRSSGGSIVQNDIHHSQSGIYGYLGTDLITIEGNQIHDHAEHGIWMNKPTMIQNNVIENNASYGIYYGSGSIIDPISGNTLSGNGLPARLPFSGLPEPAGGNTFSGNTEQTLEVVGNLRSTPVEFPIGDVSLIRVVSGEATISEAAMMVHPGSVFKMDSNTGFKCSTNAILRMVGEEASPIIITSSKDDSVLGDTNGDGVSSGAPNDWRSITFEANALVGEGESAITHTKIQYGYEVYSAAAVHITSSEIGYMQDNGIEFRDTTGTITQSQIHHTGNHAVYFRNSGGSIVQNDIHHSQSGIYGYLGTDLITIEGNQIHDHAEHGIWMNKPTTIQNNVIENNASYGIYYGSGSIIDPISGNTLSGNGLPARLPFSGLPEPAGGNTFSGNTEQTIEVVGNLRSNPVEFPIADVALIRVVSGEAIISEAAMMVHPGSVFKMDSNTGIKCSTNAILRMVGEEGSPIIITSSKDDTVLGDTNGDGVSSGTPYDWSNLTFEANALVGEGESTIAHTKILFGNQVYSKAELAITNCEIAYMQDNGIQFYDTTGTITQSQIHHTGNHAVYFRNSGGSVVQNDIHHSQSGIYGYSGTALISLEDNQIHNHAEHGIWMNKLALIQNNVIENNASYGIFYASGSAIDPISGNSLSGNRVPARLPFSGLPLPGDSNSWAGNTNQVLEIIGNTRSQDVAFPISEITIHRVVSGTLQITDASLIANPGSVFKLNAYSGFTCKANAILRFEGTELDPVIITSSKDDSVLGDTNGDGESTGSPGDWASITYESGAKVGSGESEIRHTKITYGQQVYTRSALAVSHSEIGWMSNYGMYYRDTEASISHTQIHHNEDHGIYLYQTIGQILSCDIHNNEVGLYGYSGTGMLDVFNNQIHDNQSHGIASSGRQLDIQDNTLSNNTGYGIYFSAASSSPIPTGNTIDSNGKVFRLPFSMLPNQADGNTILNNQNSTWEILGNRRDSDLTLTNQTTYYLVNGYDPRIETGAVLSLEPGTIWKFGTNRSLYVNGVLNAVGTEDEPILFTSYRDDSIGTDVDGDQGHPQNGDWGAIRFENAPANQSVMDHVRIRYGGKNIAGLVWFYNSNMAIQNTHISNSSSSAVAMRNSDIQFDHVELFANREHGIHLPYATNSTVTNSMIYGNLGHGIHISNGSAVIDVSQTRFFANQGDAVYQTSGSTQTTQAANNWWGSEDGPSSRVQNPPLGQHAFLSLFTTGSTVDSFYNASETLSINADDTLILSVYLHADRMPRELMVIWYDGSWEHRAFWGENLLNIGTDGTASRYYMGELPESDSWVQLEVPANLVGVQNTVLSGFGVRYYGGQVIWDAVGKRDASLQETIWVDEQFPADVTVSGNGQWVHAFAYGSGESLDPRVAFEPVLTTGPSFNSFDAGGTDHHNYQISEPVISGGTGSTEWGDEAPYSILFNDVDKRITFDFAGLKTDPNKAYQVLVTYLNQDTNGSTQIMTDDQDRIIHPTLETKTTPTTYAYAIPHDSITAEGNLQLVVQGQSGDRAVVSGLLLVEQDGSGSGGQEPPSPPLVTNYPAPPETTSLTTDSVLLEGTRDENTSVWINNVMVVAMGSGDWQYQQELAQGDNQLALVSRDDLGQESAIAYVNFYVDSVAPTVDGVDPVNNSYVATAPATVTIQYTEATSGLDQDASTTEVTLEGQSVPGSWDVQSDQMIFTPDSAFVEGTYQVHITLIDQLGNAADLFESTFTFDETAPNPPTVDPVTSPTSVAVQTLTGTKDAETSIYLNGELALGVNAETTWSVDVTLTTGTNELAFTAHDRAGNASTPTVVQIVFDDQAPGAVPLTLNGEGDGVSIALDWTAYDEQANGGDISEYQIYQSNSDFTEVNQATQIGTTQSGQKTFLANALARDTVYYFAVVALDGQGNFNPGVTAQSTTTVDIEPPAEVTDVVVDSYNDRLEINWVAPTTPDCIGHRLYLNGSETPIELDLATQAYVWTELTSATSYVFKLATLDGSGNESIGIERQAATLLNNPGNLQAVDGDSFVDLSWDSVEPSAALQTYRVYVSQVDFTSVDGMTIHTSTSSTHTKLTGLQNGQTYYVAVTAVNISGGELKDVTTLSTMPITDNTGPQISQILWNTLPLNDGTTLDEPGTVLVSASDPSQMSRVSVAIDGQTFGNKYGQGPSYLFPLDIAAYSDGAHTLTIFAYDSLDNLTQVDRSIAIDLAPPAAPGIQSPESGVSVNKETVFISGVSEANCEIKLFNNNELHTSTVQTSETGQFSFPYTLSEGLNRIEVSAVNRGGESPRSNATDIYLDLTIPKTPGGLEAKSSESGAILLSWRDLGETNLKGFNVYRSSSLFTDKGQAQKLNSTPISKTTYTDLPASDGDYYYAVTAVNQANSESDCSSTVSATSDRISPKALQISYLSQGAYDPVSERFGLGLVEVTVEMNEELLTTPFLTMTPDGGVPIPVSLTKEDEVTYSGTFEITHSGIDSLAYAVLSARDLSGNRGSEVELGSTLLIDTKAPNVSHIQVTPVVPIKNENGNPTEITAVFTFDETFTEGEMPSLSYILSESQAEPIQIAAAKTGDTTYQAVFNLTDHAGESPEAMMFRYSGMDDLANTSSVISHPNFFEIYQGSLPPLPTPKNVKAVAKPQGHVDVTWNAVEEAVGYQIYRQAPGESQLTPLTRVFATEDFNDATQEDGLYAYSVASIRQANSQESLSPQSLVQQAEADSIPPDAPQNLNLELKGHGVLATWTHSNAQGLTYRLYRSDQPEITNIQNLTPMLVNIVSEGALDPEPSQSEHTYAVTAIDQAGNESAPSSSSYLNFELLPVNPLSIRWDVDGLPQLSWDHQAPQLSGYHVFLGPIGANHRLNADILQDPQFVDTDFDQDSRSYTVVAVDEHGVQSPGRTLLLPMLSFDVPGDVIISRGLMNKLWIQVQNPHDYPLDHLSLSLTYEGKLHKSNTFGVDANTTVDVAIVAGGYQDLPDVVEGEITLSYQPNSGERTDLTKSCSISVRDDVMMLNVQPESFVKGGLGQARFEFQNTSDAEVEMVLAQGNGTHESDQIRFFLLDQDENVITASEFKQYSGLGVITLPNGTTVVRIPPGSHFISDPVDFEVPENVPDLLYCQVQVDAFHYHLGQDDHVVLTGQQSRAEIVLSETSYDAEITLSEPSFSLGDEPIQFSGRAYDRQSGQNVPYVSVSLLISNKGFVRSFELQTDQNGEFSHQFEPLKGETGTFKAWARHPDLNDSSSEAEFSIFGIKASPDQFTVRSPRNFALEIELELEPPEGLEAHNIQFNYLAQHQTSGQLTEGIQIILNDAIPILDQKTKFGFTFAADNRAPDQGQVFLSLDCDETGPGEGTLIAFTYTLSEAAPSIRANHSFLETGVAQDETITESITLENKGLASLHNVQIELKNGDGSQAPSWAFVSSPKKIDEFKMGQEVQVDLLFAPPSSVPVSQGAPYEFKIEVKGDEQTKEIPVYVFVDNSGTGSALFKIYDMYSGQLNGQGQLIPGLSGARVKLDKETGTPFTIEGATDSSGEFLFQDLPTGRYQYRVTAQKHDAKLGRLWVRPSVTSQTEVFLNTDLVTVEWEVVPITIEDRYEIVLNATYETNVPAAVLVIEPAAVLLPNDLQKGDVFTGEFKLTNYGLIQARDVTTKIREPNEHYKLELLTEIPEIVPANESMRVAYRVTCLAPLDRNDGASNGGGCFGSTGLNVSHKSDCGKGTQSGNAPFSASSSNGDCGGDDNSGPGGGFNGDGDGDGGGGTGSGNPGIPMVSDCPDTNPFAGFGGFVMAVVGFPTLNGCDPVWKNAACWVNLYDGSYTDEAFDLTAKVPGGPNDIFSQGLDHLLPNPLDITSASFGGFAPWASGRGVNDSSNGSGSVSGSDSGYASSASNSESFGGDYSSADHVPVPKINPFDEIGLPFPDAFENPMKEVDGSGNPNTRGKNNLLTIKRVFVNNRWQWEHERYSIREIRDPEGEWRGVALAGIGYFDPKYPGNTDELKTFLGINSSIEYDPATGYRWQDVFGFWMTFDLEGRLRTFGSLEDQMIAEITYPAGEATRADRMLDRNGRTVFWLEYNQENKLSAIRDEDQRRVEYTWDGDKLVSVTNVLSHQAHYEYDSSGRMTKSVHPGGSFDQIEYNRFGYVKSLVNNAGKGYIFDYLTDEFRGEHYAAVTSSSGRVEETWFDRSRRMIRKDINGVNALKQLYGSRHKTIVEPNGNRTKLDFNDRGFLSSVTFEDDSQIAYTYNGVFPKSYINVLGKVTEYDFQNYLLQSITEAKGLAEERTVRFTYDALGQLTQYTFEEDEAANNATYTISYDTLGNIASITDPEGAVSRFLSHNWHGNPIEYQDAEGHLWKTDYDLAGRFTRHTDPLNYFVQYEYDELSRLTAYVDEINNRYEFVYDESDNLTDLYDPFGNKVSNEFNLDNRLTKTTDQDGHTLSYEYDSFGRLTQLTDGLGNAVSISYNPLDPSGHSPIKIDYPSFEQSFHYNSFYDVISIIDRLDPETTHSTHYGYDLADRLISETDAEGNTANYEYDPINRMTREKDHMEGVETYSHAKWNELLAYKDANGRTYSSEYDKAGRVTKDIRPLGQETLYEYDDLDQLISVIDPKGQMQRYVYDAVGNVIETHLYAVGDPINPQKSILFTYDERGLMTGYDDGDTSAIYVYDEMGRLINEKVNYGPFEKEHHYTWYTNSTKQSYRGPDGQAYEYAYDQNSRIETIALPSGETISWSDPVHGIPSKLTYPGGIVVQTQFDAYLNPTQIEATLPDTSTAFLEKYKRSSALNLIEREYEGTKADYGYDANHRLTSAINQGVDDEAYSYDPAGNRLTSADTTGEWRYDGNNALVFKGDYTFEHDANGNRTLRQLGSEIIRYFYDLQNQLIRVEDGAGTVIATYGYDPFGRRIWKEVQNVRTWFHYADEGLVAEMDATGAVLRSYGYPPDTFASSDPLFIKENGAYNWIIKDHIGYPIRVVDSNGGIVWSVQHDSFGELIIDLEALRNPFRFPGQYHDPETGLYYNWNRFYDEDTGRFLTWDPVEDGTNHYLYAENDPHLFVDPDGLRVAWWAATTFTPQGRAVKIASSFARAVKAGRGAKRWAKAAKAARRMTGTKYCFPKGTLVVSSTGLVPIEKIEVGDLVSTFNDNTLAEELKSVTKLFERKTNFLISINLETEEILATIGHPFWVKDHGWIEAKDLKPGDTLVSLQGDFVIIDVKQSSCLETVVYNFEVQDNHNYLVGLNQIRVHNSCDSKPSLDSVKAALRKVHQKVGKMGKGKKGKKGSPQRGTPKKGYRLDPPHPNRKPSDPESDWHINYWDYSDGKRGKGGISGAIRCK